jgi:hypothetical protein
VEFEPGGNPERGFFVRIAPPESPPKCAETIVFSSQLVLPSVEEAMPSDLPGIESINDTEETPDI